jgi:hypothetical protein
MSIQNTLRLTGCAGIAGVLLMFAGDMLLYGGLYGGPEFLEISRRIMGEIPRARLMAGGIVGPIAASFCALGFWHVYLALRGGGTIPAAVTFAAFASMYVVGGTYHAGFVYTGLIVRAKNAAEGIDSGAIEALLRNSNEYLHLLFTITCILGGIATIAFLYAVLCRKTLYPKWIVLITPTLLILARPLVAQIPAPAGSIIYGGLINLSFLLFFCISTAILWNDTRAAQR